MDRAHLNRTCKVSLPVLLAFLGCHPATENSTSSFNSNTAASPGGDLLKDYKASIGSLAISPDGKKLATGTGYDSQFDPGAGEAKLWDLGTGRQLASWDGLSGRVQSITFSPDGRMLAMAYCELIQTGRHGGGAPRITGMVKLWNLESNREITTLKNPREGIARIAFSSNAKRLVTGDWGGTIRIWDLVTLKESRSFWAHDNPVGALSFSSDGATLASAGGEVIRLDNVSTKRGPGIIKVWDPETGKLRKTIKGHKDFVSSLVFLPDGKRLVTGSDDKTIKVWDLETGAEVRTLTGHSAAVSEVAISADGKKLASSSYDRTVRLWDLETGKELFSWQHERGVTGLAFSPDGKIVAAGVGEMPVPDKNPGEVKLWEVETGNEVRLPR